MSPRLWDTATKLMNKEQVRACIEQIGIIPAIRVHSEEDALFAAEAVTASGIPIVEVTMTVPGAVKVIDTLVRTHPNLIVGAGTLFDIDTVRRCLDVGAKFVTAPGLDLEIVDFARKNEVVVFPGALTPTEITVAWKAGADFVKVFPCSMAGGPTYIKSLKLPFPDVRLIAAGGVTQHNAAEFILAGAVALGIGTHLVQPAAITRRERGWVLELGRRYLHVIQEAREQLKG
jgi:2-dehydro-3-deoxyphosphogluconate aldolase/(4S)-4-hydroxy-2-oxoglutarate aldolase